MAGAHGGSVAGVLLKASVSAGVGPRAGSSPPPSTITALIAGELCSAAAPTRTRTMIAFGLAAPAPITSFDEQVKLVAPTAPLQVQPVPAGTASRLRPGGRRSETRTVPLLATSPPLRTRIV
jgi:hypothetical protein